jgi:uncharacterized membrane protein
MNIRALALIALSSLSLAGSALAAATPTLDCGGTEPFWGVTVKGSQVVYSDAGDSVKKTYTIANRTEAAGMAEGFAFEISATRTLKSGKKKTAVLDVINAGESGCSDGMSDTVYKYHLLAKIDGKVLYGCCN